MADVQDVARFFIGLARRQNDLDHGGLMTNLRLQKPLYFAQGWHLARFGQPLFDASIGAWPYGPAVPEAYRAYKEYGREGISSAGPPAAGAFPPGGMACCWM